MAPAPGAANRDPGPGRAPRGLVARQTSQADAAASVTGSSFITSNPGVSTATTAQPMSA